MILNLFFAYRNALFVGVNIDKTVALLRRQSEGGSNSDVDDVSDEWCQEIPSDERCLQLPVGKGMLFFEC